MSQRTIPHVPALDGLRGAAVLAVVVFHLGFLTGGYLGVDLFFVLSGFLITSLLLAEGGGSGRIDLPQFWARRARRLLPALLFVLLAVAAYAAFFASPIELDRLRADGLSTIFYIANWNAIASNQSYWAQFSTPSPLQHTWSLAIEEQFYVIWPLVVAALFALGRRTGRAVGRARDAADAATRSGRRQREARRLLVVCLVLAAASALTMIVRYQPGEDTSRLYFGTDTRAAAILLGAALACWRVAFGTTTSRARRRALEIVALVSVAGLVAAWIWLDGQSPWVYRGGLLLCGVAATAVIAAASHPTPGIVARGLSVRPLCLLGFVSYGLYLWHWPIIVWLSPERLGFDGLPLLALRVVAITAITTFSYRVVEMPIRNRRMPATLERRLALPALVVTALLLILASVPPAPAVSADEAAAGVRALGSFPGSPAGTAAGARSKVLLVGDSVGARLGGSLDAYQDHFGIEAHDRAIVGCGMVRSNFEVRLLTGETATLNSCAGQFDMWRREIDQVHPDVVLVVFGWPGDAQRLVDGRWQMPCDPGFDTWYQGEVEAGLRILTSGGAPVYLTDVPYLRVPSRGHEADRYTDCLNATYAAAAAAVPGVHLVPLAAHICPGGVCDVERDGVVLRPDGLHFDGASSVWTADWVLRQVWAAPPAAAPSGP